MKKDIHPEYREVVFYDVGADFKFVTRSTAPAKDTIEFEGQEYPVIKLEISSASHPFFTGSEKIMDSLGRVDRFQRKFGSEYFRNSDKKKGGSRRPRT